MFKHVLVPLDGSPLAEAALPAAVYIARAFGASITLIHIIEQNAPKEIHGERHLTNEDEACDYLDSIAQRLPPALPAEQHVHTTEVSNVARSIVDHVGETASDLIVMCTHGRGGVHAWLFGSIAQQVIALGSCPVLLIQPPDAGDAPPFSCQHILVPLDGNPDHEASLPIVSEMARTCAAAVHLMTVVNTTSTLTGEQASTARMLPTAAAALLNLTNESARAYLQQHEARLRAQGLAVTAQTYRGEPAAVIAQTAEQIGADVIVLGTHGKAGMDAFWSGSVTPKVARQTHIPLLLIRAADES